jgi:hypothetical protein
METINSMQDEGVAHKSFPVNRVILTEVNHIRDLVAIEFFVVPTVRFKILFVLVVLAHHRRKVVHFYAAGVWESRAISRSRWLTSSL